MNDKELLEFAAKAAGHDLKFSQEWHDGDDPQIRVTRGKWVGRVSWNPLEDDADAFQLIVKCKIDLLFGNGDVESSFTTAKGYFEEVFLEFYNDEQSKMIASRRAIVRAAAEIGKGM